MAMMLAPVAVAGLGLVAAWWRWGSKDQDQDREREREQQPLDDDSYWGYNGGDDGGRSGASPMLRQQQPLQAQQPHQHTADWPGSQPVGASPSFGPPPQAWATPLPPQMQPAQQYGEVEQLRMANQHLSQQLAHERQRSAALSRGASAQELELRQSVLELNARLLDAEDERAVEREELASKLQQAQAAAGGPKDTAVDGPPHEGGASPAPSSTSGSSSSTSATAIRQAYEIPAAELQLGEKIGEGGFGAVYKGVWRGGEVAVKKLHCVTSAELLDEFFAEVATLSALRHPNIMLFMGATTQATQQSRPGGSMQGGNGSSSGGGNDVGAVGGASGESVGMGLSIVSEYLCGGSLWDYLHSPTVSYSWETAMVMAADIAKGVAHLHGEGIIHRDLK
jgi:hypothetical protein